MRIFSWIVGLILVAHAVPASAQDSLEQAKRHYDAAAYEEALSTLNAVSNDAEERAAEIHQYRALCLLALGKTAEAEQAVVELVAADPMYLPASSVASPKILTSISGYRAKALPTVARRLLEEGRTAFNDKKLQLAQDRFALLLRVLDDDVMRSRADNEDLRVLASGFVALTGAMAAPPPASAASRSPSAPEPAVTDARPSEGASAAAAPSAVIPAKPLRQVLPPWNAPDRLSGLQAYSGTLAVRIGADGKVKSARVQKPTHPAYDARLLQASSSWLYTPATQNGVPVESERVIEVQLLPGK